MNRRIILTVCLFFGLAVTAGFVLSACSSSGSTRTYMSYGAGYRGYYHRPWGYRPIYIGGEVDPDWGVEPGGGLEAMPQPEMGMPDFGGGGMDFGGDAMDFGGFDW